MGQRYIQSEKHLRNIILKTTREGDRSQLDMDKVLPLNFIIEKVYLSGRNFEVADNFTWALKEDLRILEEDRFFDWLSEQNVANSLLLGEIEHIMTAEFLSRLSTLYKIPGVYQFTNKSGKSLYIGMSNDLQGRAAASFRERFSNYNKPVLFNVCICKNAADAAVLEAYFISKLKPALNGTGKYSHECTVEIVDLPEWDDPVLCNIVGSRRQK